MIHEIRVGRRFDIVVAGAGHNSLVAACYLAKAGYRYLVLEGRAVPGEPTGHHPSLRA
jgi:phytoene dehydrogenase-like protein